MISLNDVLLAMSNIPVDDPIAEIWGQGLQSGYKIIEYTGSLPITITANGDALLDYRIYGADGGVGEPTENLWNPDNIINATVIGSTLKIFLSSDWRTIYIPCEPNETYTIHKIVSMYYRVAYTTEFPGEGVQTYGNIVTTSVQNVSITTGSDAKYIIAVVWGRSDTTNLDDILNSIMVVKGSTAPTSYIPYGYKLPMTVGDGNTEQTVPVYIGENQLDAGEYVSYGEQKIYRDVDGTLTPTDPPVPLPDIPTIDGETVIDYDGDPKPSQMYIKYKGKG